MSFNDFDNLKPEQVRLIEYLRNHGLVDDLKDRGYLTPKLASRFISVAESTLAHWRGSWVEGGRRYGPPFVRLNEKHVLYKLQDLCDWLDARIMR